MTTSTMAVSPRRDPSIAFPLVLISVGIVVLLANAGYLRAVRWTDLLQLWPVLLVLGGVDLLLRPRSFFVAAIAEIAIVIAAIAFLVSGIAAPSVTAAFETTVPRAGVTDVNFTFNYGAGVLSIAGGGSDLILVRSTRQDVTRTVNQTGTSASVVVSADEAMFGQFGERRWDVTMPSDVRTGMTLNLGAGDFDLDLSTVSIVRATINTGASDLTIRLPRPKGDVPITISAGASSIQIDVPSGVEYRIDDTGAMHSVSGLKQSAGYAAATDRVTIKLSAAMSSVTIR